MLKPFGLGVPVHINSCSLGAFALNADSSKRSTHIFPNAKVTSHLALFRAVSIAPVS